ncbi:dihydrofolate reductase family protein [Rudaea sp.]|uniref:dihydrofolate reductase family protein n=1 Tax=Rudaea sp. TaxID=2136325 RepID=UPI002ED11A23
MRKMIAAMKISADGKFGNADGYADWVDAWSEDYGLTAQIDACMLGGHMYPGYEQYWTATQNAPDQPLPMTGRLATPAEIEWARFAAKTTHYVLSNTLASALWPKTRILRGVEEIAALKQQPGKDIYLMGGGRITSSLIDAGLVDELRLIVHPLIAGNGRPLFTMSERRALELRHAQPLSQGQLSLVYAIH